MENYEKDFKNNGFKSETDKTEKFEKPVEKVSFKVKAKNILELTINDTKALLNGDPITCFPAPFKDQYRVWVPLDFIETILGSEIKIDGNKITIERSI